MSYPFTLDSMIRAAAAAVCEPPAMIRGPRVYQPLPHARFAVCLAARRRGFSLAQIGRALGGRDHTTVLHSIRRADSLLGDADFAHLLDQVERAG